MGKLISGRDVMALARSVMGTSEPAAMDYADYHRHRIAFVLNLVLERVGADGGDSGPVRLLDVGPHFLTRCLKEFLGERVVLDTLGWRQDALAPRGLENRHFDFDLNDSQHASRWISVDEHDIVVMSEVIEHLHTSPRRVLGFINTALADQGTLILQTPNACSLEKRWSMFLGRNPFEPLGDDPRNPGHFREYTAEELEELCLETGYDSVRVFREDYWRQRGPLSLFARLVPGLRSGLTLVCRKSLGADVPEVVDSSQGRELKADVEVRLDYRVPVGSVIAGTARIRNRGPATWLPHGSGRGSVRLGAQIFDGSGTMKGDYFTELSTDRREITPGDCIEVPFEIPASEKGTWTIEFDAFAEGIGWFADAADRQAKTVIEVY